VPPAKAVAKPAAALLDVFSGFDSYNSNIVETTVLMDGPGVLFGIVINTAQSGATASFYDANDVQGTINIPNATRKANVLLANQGTIAYEAKMYNGLVIATAQGAGGTAADVTFIYKQAARPDPDASPGVAGSLLGQGVPVDRQGGGLGPAPQDRIGQLPLRGELIG
jgi:hypothetical protein